MATTEAGSRWPAGRWHRNAYVAALVVAVAASGLVETSAAAGSRTPTVDLAPVTQSATASVAAQRVGSATLTTGIPATSTPTSPIFPMQTKPRCAILDNFGDPRSGGRVHQGTDMLATLGQEVYAVVDGTLTDQTIDGAANSALSGNLWRLTTTGSKTFYYYMHLSRFADGLSIGSVVTQGQVIGYVGDTGDAGPGNYHLHFEVHPNGGAAVNALTVLPIPADCTVT